LIFTTRQRAWRGIGATLPGSPRLDALIQTLAPVEAVALLIGAAG